MSEHAIPLNTLTEYLDTYLQVREVPDENNAVNGLQVENRGTVDRIVAAVDASLEAILGAAPEGEGGGTLLLVHHGLLWDGNAPLTGRRYRRVRALLDRNIALYSAHIPLDIHPEVGNNMVLARRLDIALEGWFGDYRGQRLGVYGELVQPREELVRRIEGQLTASARLIPGGPAITGHVGIVTGSGGGFIAQAKAAGIDTLITGEGAHHTYFDAVELGVNVIYAGHYATEQVGVQALAQHLGLRFELPWEFHRHPTGM
ncbi:MAG TPA: Nif3-like dinuclear metal center hexameric protein [Gemmatimonadales bacterium]|jgi:dinuclear metal center YbgI/SA1388 family protein|nr:Nif3-like dinuclear metal center hexameric protein [Gemmatimonadales bacterium]